MKPVSPAEHPAELPGQVPVKTPGKSKTSAPKRRPGNAAVAKSAKAIRSGTKSTRAKRARTGTGPAKSSVGQWRARVSETLAAGINQLTDPKLPAARQVQKGRQATKAARALLRLAPSGLKRQARGLIMGLSTVRRLLAETRDTDALIETLNRVAAETKLTKPARAALIKPLRTRRLPLGRLQDDEAAQAVAMLKKIAATVAKLPLPEGGRSLAKAALKEYRTLRREARPGLDRLDIEDLHDLRKRAINHRHQSTFLATLAEGKQKARLEKRAERAQKLHEAIGAHRDLELLAEYLRPSREPLLRAERQRLLEAIDRQQQAALKDAIAVVGKLTQPKPRRLLRDLSLASPPARARRPG